MTNENNNTIFSLTEDYKKRAPNCQESARAQSESMKELCKERNNLYEKQNDLKGQKHRVKAIKTIIYIWFRGFYALIFDT